MAPPFDWASRRNLRRITSAIAATSFWPSKPLMANLRYSLGRGRPSSKTTIEATTSSAPRLDTSKHSIRSGGVARSSASEISLSAWLRAVRSPDRRSLCVASDCAALRSTVSSRVRLSPRRGIATRTEAPRRWASHSASTVSSASAGSAVTSTSRGMSASGSPYIWARSEPIKRPSSASSTRSTMNPRSPRMRPPRTWNTRSDASSSSLTRPTMSTSVRSGSTTVFRSSALRRANRSSRSRAACS